MKLSFIILLAASLALASCSSRTPLLQKTAVDRSTLSIALIPTDTPTPVKAPAIDPIKTASPIPKYTQKPAKTISEKELERIEARTPSSTPAPTFTSTPTLGFQPYPMKQVVLEYSSSFHFDGLFNDILDYATTAELVLYSDGQLIISRPNSEILTKNLSEVEMNDLIFQLKSKGLYSIITNHKNDHTDPLYNFGTPSHSSAEAPIYCISVYGSQPRTICFAVELREFLVPKMKDLLQFIENYAPDNMTVYQPDRILLQVEKGNKLAESTDESMTSIPWPADLPSLHTTWAKRMYFEGQTAAKAFSLLKQSNIFNENGQDYTVYFQVVLPHQALKQPQY